VLLAIEGDRLLGDRLGPIAARVDRVVASVLKDASPRRWLAQHHLRWLAEASPNAFLDAVEADLRQDEPALFSLMRPVTSSMGRCDRTELLWALELLAWEPRRFPRVFAVLARLSEVNIKDNWANKPEASLGSLVCYWLPQTAANVEERINVVSRFAKTRSPVAWRLLLAQLPRRGGHATPNMRPRWREVATGAGRPTHNEVRTFVLAIVDLLVDWENTRPRSLPRFFLGSKTFPTKLPPSYLIEPNSGLMLLAMLIGASSATVFAKPWGCGVSDRLAKTSCLLATLGFKIWLNACCRSISLSGIAGFCGSLAALLW
jgi:hypothetical protein